MTAAIPAPAWLVGCGNMAGAMVEGWRSAGVDFRDVTVIRPSGLPVEGVRTVSEYPASEQPQFVMLGFKPQKLDEVAPGLAPYIGRDTSIVSMLAGVTAATLRDRFPNARAVVRIMPNLPVAETKGVTAIYSPEGRAPGLIEVDRVMAALGRVVWCKTEAELGMIGAVAAAGVAYVAKFADALAKGGHAMGLEPAVAYELAVQTLVGTGAYATATGASMAEIVRRVASPGGTTEQGLAILDACDGLQALVNQTLAAAVRRGLELAAEAARD